VNENGVLQHSKIGRSRLRRVIHDPVEPASFPAMSAMPSIATEMVRR
jgi:hypothetical protein